MSWLKPFTDRIRCRCEPTKTETIGQSTCRGYCWGFSVFVVSDGRMRSSSEFSSRATREAPLDASDTLPQLCQFTRTPRPTHPRSGTDRSRIIFKHSSGHNCDNPRRQHSHPQRKQPHSPSSCLFSHTSGHTSDANNTIACLRGEGGMQWPG